MDSRSNSPISPRIAERNEAILRDAPPTAIENIKKLMKELIHGVHVNEPAITAAVMKAAKRGLHSDAADLCRMVSDMPFDTIKKFSSPELTHEQVEQIKGAFVRMGGGGKKKRRTGKKSKRKTRKARTIKKNGKKRN